MIAADGAHPYFVPVEHTRTRREMLGPGKLLAPELAVVLESDPDEARRLARLHTGCFYLQRANYVENLRWLGWSDDDLAGGGSDALVDAIVAWGDEEAIAARVGEHLDAGADHVCIQPVTEVRPLSTVQTPRAHRGVAPPRRRSARSVIMICSLTMIGGQRWIRRHGYDRQSRFAGVRRADRPGR